MGQDEEVCLPPPLSTPLHPPPLPSAPLNPQNSGELEELKEYQKWDKMRRSPLHSPPPPPPLPLTPSPLSPYTPASPITIALTHILLGSLSVFSDWLLTVILCGQVFGVHDSRPRSEGHSQKTGRRKIVFSLLTVLS